MKKFFYILTLVMAMACLTMFLLTIPSINLVSFSGVYKNAFITIAIIGLCSLIASNSAGLFESHSMLGATGVSILFFACLPLIEMIWMNLSFNSSFGYIVVANCILAFFINSVIAFSMQLQNKAVFMQFCSYIAVFGMSVYGAIRLYAPKHIYELTIVKVIFVICVVLYVTNSILLPFVAESDGTPRAPKEPKPPKEKKKKKDKTPKNDPDAPLEQAPIDPSINQNASSLSL